MLPTPDSAHIDAALTNIAIGYNSPIFVADRVFPHVTVAKQSDKYFKFLKGDWFRLDADVRGAGAMARQGGYKLTSASYNCLEYALAHPVPIELINNADAAIDPLRTAVQYVTRQIQLRKEYQVSSLVTTAANWTTSNDAEGGWLYSGTSTFIADVYAAKEVVRGLIGIEPNCMIMDAGTWNSILQTDDVLDRIVGGATGNNPAIVTKQLVAQLFGLDEIIVGGAVYSSDEETVAGTEFTAVKLWETNATKGSALLFYRTPTPAINEPNAGYIFEWPGDAGQQSEVIASDVYRTVRRWWDDARKAWMIEGSECFDEVVTCADAGYLFYDTLAT